DAIYVPDDDGEYHFIFDVWDEPGFNDKA
ncbi:MAG: hypothetical protein UU96_C0026G0001, partial [Parcubacteria group bacterium GW2011_GWC2_42_13]